MEALSADLTIESLAECRLSTTECVAEFKRRILWAIYSLPLQTEAKPLFSGRILKNFIAFPFAALPGLFAVRSAPFRRTLRRGPLSKENREIYSYEIYPPPPAYRRISFFFLHSGNIFPFRPTAFTVTKSRAEPDEKKCNSSDSRGHFFLSARKTPGSGAGAAAKFGRFLYVARQPSPSHIFREDAWIFYTDKYNDDNNRKKRTGIFES